MKVLLILALVAYANANPSDGCCRAEDRAEVERLWEDIWSAEFTGRRVAVAQAVFADVFERAPGTKALFARVNAADPNSAEFKAHCVRVVNGLDTCINLLDDPATLDQELSHLNAQHKARSGIKADMFDVIGASFAKVMPQVSSCFNPDAWSRCFKRIARGISDGL